MAGPAADYRETGVRFPPLLFVDVWSVTHLARRLPGHGSEAGSIPAQTAVLCLPTWQWWSMHPPEERNILVRSQGSALALREELERSSIGPTHRGTGFDSLLAHFGAVAQSGEHLVCTQAVVGSMPTGSTCFRSSVEESAWLRTRRAGVRVPPGTLCCLCTISSRDRSGGRSPGSYPGGRRFESDSRNFARVVEPPGRHTGSRGQRASRPMRVRPSPRVPLTPWWWNHR
jgi:hypothetical protein